MKLSDFKFARLFANSIGMFNLASKHGDKLSLAKVERNVLPMNNEKTT